MRNRHIIDVDTLIAPNLKLEGLPEMNRAADMMQCEERKLSHTLRSDSSEYSVQKCFQKTAPNVQYWRTFHALATVKREE